RPIEPLEVTVDDPRQVVELFAAGEADRAQAFRLIALAIAEKRPDANVVGLRESPIAEVTVIAGMVDRHDGPQAHAHGGVLPEVGHQPGVGIAGEPATFTQLLAEVLHPGFVEPT